jgi:TonB family protein
MDRYTKRDQFSRLSRLFLARRERDASYRRVILIASSVSLVLHVCLLLLGPSSWNETFERRSIGYRGPMQVLPELSVLDDRISDLEQPFLDIRGIESSDIIRAYDISVFRNMAENVTDAIPTSELAEKISDFEYDLDLGELLRSSIPQPASDQVVIRKLVKPQYPPESVLNEVEGLVELKVLVSKEGYVLKVWLISSEVDTPSENSAISAAWQFEFEPYLVDGKAVHMLVSVPIRFRLRDRPPEPG